MIPIYSYMIKNLPSLFCTANESLKRLRDWFVANKLSLNVAKTYYSVFGATESQVQDLDLKLIINGENIESIDCVYKKIIKFTSIFIKYELT